MLWLKEKGARRTYPHTHRRSCNSSKDHSLPHHNHHDHYNTQPDTDCSKHSRRDLPHNRNQPHTARSLHPALDSIRSSTLSLTLTPRALLFDNHKKSLSAKVVKPLKLVIRPVQRTQVGTATCSTRQAKSKPHIRQHETHLHHPACSFANCYTRCRVPGSPRDHLPRPTAHSVKSDQPQQNKTQTHKSTHLPLRSLRQWQLDQSHQLDLSSQQQSCPLSYSCIQTVTSWNDKPSKKAHVSVTRCRPLPHTTGFTVAFVKSVTKGSSYTL